MRLLCQIQSVPFLVCILGSREMRKGGGGRGERGDAKCGRQKKKSELKRRRDATKESSPGSSDEAAPTTNATRLEYAAG